MTTVAIRDIALLKQDALNDLARPVDFRIGYQTQRPEERTNVVQVDARALAKLIQDAAMGQRVYELMTIERPGDIHHYLWVTVPDHLSPLAKTAREGYASRFRFRKPMVEICQMSFTDFDAGFVYDGDDTKESTMLWRTFKDTPEWRQLPTRLLQVVFGTQARLRSSGDYLVQNEIALIHRRVHYLDFSSTVKRYCEIDSTPTTTEAVPAAVFELIIRLVKQPDVRSVSCPFQDFALWRELIAEQVRRSIALGVAPQEALRLNGPDSGIPFVCAGDYRPDLAWGGEVHIPYEGACDGDLFIQPKWFGFTFEETRADPPLRHPTDGNYIRVGSKLCKYLLTPWQTLGDIAAAERTAVGGWILYSTRGDRPSEDLALTAG